MTSTDQRDTGASRDSVLLWGTSIGALLIASLVIMYGTGDPIGFYNALGIQVDQRFVLTTDCSLKRNSKLEICKVGNKQARADREWKSIKRSKKSFTPFSFHGK